MAIRNGDEEPKKKRREGGGGGKGAMLEAKIGKGHGELPPHLDGHGDRLSLLGLISDDFDLLFTAWLDLSRRRLGGAEDVTH